MIRFKHFITVLVAFILGCGPIHFSGASAPTDHTHRLTEADIAYAESDRCLHEITGDPETDLANDMAFFNERSIRVQELRKDVWPYATALRGRVLVPKGYSERTTARKARTTAHERVHYCERDEFEGNDFERAYAASNNRFRFEAPAYRMNVRIMKAQGASDKAACKSIGYWIEKLRDGYWLHDLDPQQYEIEARRIWNLELIEECL